MNYWLIILLIAAGTACGKVDDKAEPIDPTEQARALYVAASDRLGGMLDRGFVVSRTTKDIAEHQGDALIWSGIAIGALDCEHAKPISAALRSMIENLNGGLFRHPDLADKISIDGALGLYKGVSSLIERCPDELPLWRDAMAMHKQFSDETGDRLNSASEIKLVREFTYVRDILFYRLGLRSEPSKDRMRLLEGQIAAWALAVRKTKASCFRINLGLISLQAVEQSGGSVSNNGRRLFCQATDGLKIPTVDYWCGRNDLLDFVAGFKFDEWEYRHQRCSGWETPDGNGLKTPGVDLLEAMHIAYKL